MKFLESKQLSCWKAEDEEGNVPSGAEADLVLGYLLHWAVCLSMPELQQDTSPLRWHMPVSWCLPLRGFLDLQ
jgi:hypothetical protein